MPLADYAILVNCSTMKFFFFAFSFKNDKRLGTMLLQKYLGLSEVK
jgi:hypothetical protein